jgi:hypothetical protein
VGACCRTSPGSTRNPRAIVVGFSKELAVDHGRPTIMVSRDRGIFRTTHRIVNLVDGVVDVDHLATLRGSIRPVTATKGGVSGAGRGREPPGVRPTHTQPTAGDRPRGQHLTSRRAERPYLTSFAGRRRGAKWYGARRPRRPRGPRARRSKLPGGGRSGRRGLDASRASGPP